ncbi:MAG: hypothetical protein IJ192_04795 [Clostridia bacterium]|nr:hypothetical protein [Clostridia bacterium]MBR2176950.1 hypothetical protein [Clostridia bacterium]
MEYEKKLYGSNPKQMKTKFIVSCVLGVILAGVMVGVNANNMDIGSLIGAGALAVVFFPFAVMSFILNFKKIFIGIFRPIPFLSYVLEYFVGLGMAFKAFFWMLKNLKKTKQTGNNADSANDFSSGNNF